YVKNVQKPPLKAALGIHAIALVQALAAESADIPPVEFGPLVSGAVSSNDLFGASPVAFVDEAVSGALLPLDPFLRRDPVVRERLEEIPLGYYTHGQSLWALPIYASPIHLHLNLDMLDGAGIKAPSAIASPGDLLAFCAQLRTRGFERPLAWGASLHALSGVFEEHGARIYDPATRRFDLSSPATLAAFGWLRELAALAAPLPSAVVESFVRQTAPLALWGQLHSAAPFRDAVLALPFKRLYAQSIGVGITRRCADPERAWRFVAGLVSPAGSRAMVKMGWVFPATRQATLASLASRPCLAPIYGQMSQTRDCPMTQMGARRLTMLNHAVGRWWEPGEGWRQSLAQAEAQLNLLEQVSQMSPEALF
ncbi:MAG TPA: hypothetical protein P5137_03385, partial [Candidatus Brocadiia bacterium]|nr:hypothetical protein [Candidatus Brocadiia bacterium]